MAGLAFFFAAKPPPLCLPHWGRGDRAAVDRVLSYIIDLRRSLPLVFHAARTLSGSLRSPPSPRGEGCVSGIAASPSNLRPFGTPPSIGRRECPREPLPLEGAAERSEAGLASFFCGEAASFLPSLLGKALYVVAMVSCKDGAAYKSPGIPAPISPAHVRGLHRRF